MRSGLILNDRYRLDELIEAGGVGQVWRAADLLLDRPVAVKLLRPEYADHPETLDRFRKEARHAGALSHPGIAQVYDYCPPSQDGATPPYLVMELVDGQSLADLLDAGPADPVFALDVIAQAAAGLDAAHQAGLVHRDIKPGNILIGWDGRVKVTDFGIAHAAGQAPVTGPGVVMGTTRYLAPERVAGGPGGASSDLYALGIVLHESLTGVPAYEGTTAEVMAAHLFAPLPDLPAAVPPELAEFVAQLTAKDPEQRLGGARAVAEMAARLRDALRDGTLPSAASEPTAIPGYQDDRAALHSAMPEPVPTAPPDHWQTPLLDGHPGGPPGDEHSRGRRRAGVLAGLATLLVGLGLAALLSSGVLASQPTVGGGPRHAGTGAAATGGRGAPSSAAGTSRGAGGSGSPSAGRQSGRTGQAGQPTSPASATSPRGSTSPGTGGSAGSSAAPSQGGGPAPTPSPSSTGSGILPTLPVPLPSASLSLGGL